MTAGADFRRRSSSAGTRGRYCFPRCPAAARAIRGSSFALRPFAQPLPSPAGTHPYAQIPRSATSRPFGPSRGPFGPRGSAVFGRLPVVWVTVVRPTRMASLRGRLIPLGLDLLELAFETIIGVGLRTDVPIARFRDRADELVEL